ncbi:MAG: trigger factor [Acidobacteriota bacterium]|jgi:trigger factor
MSTDNERDEAAQDPEGMQQHAENAHADHDHDHDHDHGHDHDHDHGPVEHEAVVEHEGARVRMKITVAADEVGEAMDEVAAMFRKQAKLQGFRRGKAPMGMIRQRFAEEIRENVLERIIPLHVGNEIKARDLKPIQNPVLEKADWEPGTPLLVEVWFDVQPEVTVTGYRDLSATKTVRPVSEESIEKAVANMREQAAKLDSIDEGGIEPGDYVVAHIELFPRDGKGKKLAEEERFVHVGEERSIPALNQQLEGQTKGSEREFVTELGDTYPNDLLAGKEVTCRIRVQEIKRRQLPAVDDEMARDLGYADLEELRGKTRESYASYLEEEAQREVARQLMDQVIGANEVTVPESLVDARLDHSMQRAAEDLARQGVDPRHSVDWVAYRDENRPHARRAVTEEILLDAIADAEDLAVDDAEVMAEIEQHQEGQPEGVASRIAQQMRQDGSFDGLRRAMLRRRALDFVKSHATIDNVEASPEASAE